MTLPHDAPNPNAGTDRRAVDRRAGDRRAAERRETDSSGHGSRLGRRGFLAASLGGLALAPLAFAPGRNLPATIANDDTSGKAGSNGRRRPAPGVSLAGPEFGTDRDDFCNTRPGQLGRDYTYNSPATVAALAAVGFETFRLPVRWERLQPVLGGPLAPREVRELRGVVDQVAAQGGRAILDLHNYGRYRIAVDGRIHDAVIDARIGGRRVVTGEHLADFWQRLARLFKDRPAVVGYGLMNEPHDMGSTDWRSISQRVVQAIRAIDRDTDVYVAGDDWSSALRWVASNGDRPWIDDPADRVVYEAHCYFDHDGSGKYAVPFEEERRNDPRIESRGVDRVRPFVDWCRRHDVRGFVGEYGVPGDEPGWGPVLRRFLATLNDHGIPACCWAAGEWWGDYRLSVQPTDGRPVGAARHVLKTI